MNHKTSPQPLFPESRLVLGLLSPPLGFFFAVCIYLARAWEPPTMGDRIGRYALEDILFTFVTVCVVGLIASLVGPQRIRPLITKAGSKAMVAVLALSVSSMVYGLYCWLTS